MTHPDILICAIDPYFLEKEGSWFRENRERIATAGLSQPFFQHRTMSLSEGHSLRLSAFLRRLDELHYEKVFTAEFPGEFSHRGGVVDVFPLFFPRPVRVEFAGNSVASIEELPGDSEDEAKARAVLKKRLASQKTFSDLKDLKEGDYLVHLDHGVARFAGMVRFEDFREFFALEYAGGDKLFVPVGLERKLSRYAGFEEPSVSRLGTLAWHKTKKRAKEDAERFAKELLSLYAEREAERRPPYPPPSEVDRALWAAFPYEETPDQKQAIEDILHDLQENTPMDRIVCGDVGFGKTEIALRTMAYAAGSGRQAVLLCPTTLLAHQHYATFRDRLKHLPFTVALVSRFGTEKEKEQVLESVAEGSADVIIGTHRLLSDRVRFRNLGLLVIDDEHKFGVGQKEKLRKVRSSVDTLSLSATPIPRTLYFALSSLKKISFVRTPPKGRLPVRTHVMPFKKEKVKEALLKGLEDKGQVYFLHNRIETIGKVRSFVTSLIPDIPVGLAHGRMRERELVEVMDKFRSGTLRVLITTTIIESGLDIPSVTAVIVDGAENLGLSQAYQIKGRAGRGSRRAEAFFFFREKLRGKARDRLQALREAEGLGQGYQIALRDMEIRGAGNILGKEQSGTARKVGLNLYCQLLTEAVEKFKGEPLANVENTGKVEESI